MSRRANPTLFDKLVADLSLDGLRNDSSGQPSLGRSDLRYYNIPSLERFNEAALRSTVLRELNWLLNTTNFHAVQDLTEVPEVATSVLNFGLGDLSGKLLHRQGVESRAREMRHAVQNFEPRVARVSVTVEPESAPDRSNVISFTIRGDISQALDAMNMEVRTEVEVDTGAVAVTGA